MMNESYKLPAPPRASVDHRAPGLRTFESHTTGKPQPVTVDNQGNYVYAPTIYVIFAVLVIGLVVLWRVMKRAKVQP